MMIPDVRRFVLLSKGEWWAFLLAMVSHVAGAWFVAWSKLTNSMFHRLDFRLTLNPALSN